MQWEILLFSAPLKKIENGNCCNQAWVLKKGFSEARLVGVSIAVRITNEDES
jgi:hypothetical protein